MRSLQMEKINTRVSLLMVLLVMVACGRSQSGQNPPGYDLGSPEKIILGSNLLEISGISFLHSGDDSVVAINDEQGKIFSVSLANGKAMEHSFSGSGDFEDVTVFRNSLFVLQSNGKLFSFGNALRNPITSREWETGVPKGDYESLYGDEDIGKLYMLCKSGKQSKGNIIAGYSFSYESDSSLSAPESFTIALDNAGIELPKGGFMPSALTKNKKTNEWYVLSSANKLLIVLDVTWKVKAAYNLKPGLFLQPEGIAFDDAQNLYISNEGDKTANGNILKFSYQGK